jgi:hypothetical protein
VEDDELAFIVALLSKLESLEVEPGVLTQIADLQWDLRNPEMWSRYIEFSELEKN